MYAQAEAARWFENTIQINVSRRIAYLNLGDARRLHLAGRFPWLPALDIVIVVSAPDAAVVKASSAAR